MRGVRATVRWRAHKTGQIFSVLAFLATPWSALTEAQPLPEEKLLADTVPGPKGNADFLNVITGVDDFKWFDTTDPQSSARTLWSSDGTTNGTSPVVLPPATHFVSPAFPAGSQLFFWAASGQNFELWHTDRATGTSNLVLNDTERADRDLSHMRHSQALNLTFFLGRDTSAGQEIWVTNGTQAGTNRLIDATPGPSDSFLLETFDLGGQTYLVSFDSDESKRMTFRTDGTSSGTERLPIDPPPSQTLTVGSSAYYLGEDSSGTSGLWRTDGSPGRAELVAEVANGIRPFLAGDNMYFLTQVNDMWELWSTDLTQAGTKKLYEAQGFPAPHSIRVAGDWLLLVEHGTSSRQVEALWAINDPDRGLELLKDCEPQCGSLFLREADQQTFYFTMSTPETGSELWMSDGTAGGTMPIVDACPGPCSSELRPAFGLPRVRNELLLIGVLDSFSVNRPISSPQATQFLLVNDRDPNPQIRQVTEYPDTPDRLGPRQFARLGNQLLFIASDPTYGLEPRAIDLPPDECTPSATTLCLGNGRFHAEVTWRDFQGGSGQGQAGMLTEDTGSFWFFDPANLELIVKVVDGTAINGNYWVFFGSLSDVGYDLTVTDTETGTVARYENEPGSFSSRGDVSALPAGSSRPKEDTTRDQVHRSKLHNNGWARGELGLHQDEQFPVSERPVQR